MRPNARLALLASLISACNPSNLDYHFDASTDARTSADTPTATTDAPTAATDTPAAATDTPATATDTPPAVDAPVAPVDVPPTMPVDVPPIMPVDSGVVPPRDAGPMPVDGGALGEPAWVPLDVRTGTTSCAPLAPCGGNETGTWDVSGGCIDVATPAQLMTCPGARIDRASGRARGRVTFAGGFARRASQWETEADLFIPQLCVAVVGGCPALAGLIGSLYPGSTCATVGAGDCRCTVRQSGAINDADRYAISDRQIVSVSSGKRWNYCVAGEQLRYADVSSGAREVGIIQLTRRAP